MGEKQRDSSKVERRVFIACVIVFLAVGLYTLYYDVSLKAFFIVCIVEAAMFVTWYVTNDRV